MRQYATVREVLDVFRQRDVGFLAASVAYYAFVSLLPLVVLTVVAASTVGGEQLTNEVIRLAEDFLSPTGQAEFIGILTDTGGQSSATAVSVVVLLWSAMKVFRGLDTAFSTIYGVKHHLSLPVRLAEAFVGFVAIAIALGAVIVVGTLSPTLSGFPFAESLSIVLSLPALALVFLPVYYFFPDTDVTLREILPGTLFAAVGWVVLQVLFRLYAANVGGNPIYSVLGGILLVVTWLYFGSTVILLGAAINVVLADRADGRDQSIQTVAEQTQYERGIPGMTDEENGEGAPDITRLHREVRDLQTELDRFEDDVEDRTVRKEELKDELKGYVRSRVRRGHAHGWGPYLVLLYGTAMTLGAFYSPYIRGGWSILAMVVVWLSTLGLYALMLVVGFGVNALGLPGRLADWIRARRS